MYSTPFTILFRLTFSPSCRVRVVERTDWETAYMYIILLNSTTKKLTVQTQYCSVVSKSKAFPFGWRVLVKSYSCCTSNLLVALSNGTLKVGQLVLIRIPFRFFFYLQVKISGFPSWSMRTLPLKPLRLDLDRLSFRPEQRATITSEEFSGVAWVYYPDCS